MIERRAWGDAFAKQARSDWMVFRALDQRSDIPRCHKLHYLQMACEKIAKSYRIRDTSAELGPLKASHLGFVKFVNAFLSSPAVVAEYEGKTARLIGLRRSVRHIARSIERLAPAVGGEATPENAEYPWESNGHVVVPADYAFPGLDLLEVASGRAILKLIDRMMRDYHATGPGSPPGVR